MFNAEDQGSLPVTQTLFVALAHLWSETEARILWVDAIFINQSYNDSKSEQVDIVGEVYRSAFRVTAWLGPEDVTNDSETLCN
ncbi:hypothetical protein Vi05172_g1357 [Venturia inaequalis]|nr:hypothetical protein Vi05172_g1357 [Venturia inaequalis]